MEPPCLILASAEIKPQAYLACAGERQRNRTEGLFLEGERELQSAFLSSAVCILIDTSIASRQTQERNVPCRPSHFKETLGLKLGKDLVIQMETFGCNLVLFKEFS